MALVGNKHNNFLFSCNDTHYSGLCSQRVYHASYKYSVLVVMNA